MVGRSTLRSITAVALTVAVLGVWAASATAANASNPHGSIARSTTRGSIPVELLAPPTTVAPTTTTTLPPSTTTTAAPAVAQAAPAAPSAPSAPSVPTDPKARFDAAFATAVPASWRAALPVTVKFVGGSTSRMYTSGTLEISSYHLNGSWSHLVFVIGHEFGHLIAFRYGTQEYLGAAPAGWPYSGSQPEEAWADCVGRAFTGIAEGSHGMAACSGDSLSWTASYVASHP